MYDIQADTEKKLIQIELSGHMEVKEWKEYINEVIEASEQFEKKKLSILISLERLDTISQESIPVCIDGLLIAADYADKIAFIHKRVITRMQLGKMIAEVNRRCNNTFHAEMFATKKEAMKFLLNRS